MKRIVTVLTTLLLSVMFTMNVFAAENPDVYYYVEQGTDSEYTVIVASTGKVTDGLVEISYDAEALTISEEDVIISENVDMYSVNVEDGVIKIAWLAGDAIPEGTFITVPFGVTDAAGDDVNVEVTFPSANDADGNDLTTGPKAEEAAPDDSTTAPDDSTAAGNDGSGTTTGTGDSSMIGLAAAVAAVSAIAIAAIVVWKKKMTAK